MAPESDLNATVWRTPGSDWRAAIEDALGKTGLDSLVTRSDDNIAIGPIYGRDAASASLGRRIPGKPWVVVQRSDDPDADRARDALSADLSGVRCGIEFVLSGSMSAERTGSGLNRLDHRLIAMVSDQKKPHLRLDAGAATYEHFPLFKNLDLDELTLSYDPLAHAAAQGGFDRPLIEIEDTIVRAAEDFHDRALHGSPVVADGRVWAAGGASEAQEIAGILGSSVQYARVLIDAGLPPEQALGSIGVIVDAGANQLLTIAKLRALRLCHARIVEAFGAVAVRLRLHAETSWRMMTRYDVHTNILRSTSAAFAAGIAGADSITVLPHTIALGISDSLARRLARNSQAILIEESGLARVDDPGAGSGAIESTTAALAEAAWSEFVKIDAAGGLAAALRAGTFLDDIARTRRTRVEKVAHRDIAITGISKFPNIEQSESGIATPRPPVAPRSTAMVETIVPLTAARFAEPFETLRDRAAMRAGAGKTPKIFLANLGIPADFAEAAQSAANFFAAGGIAVVETDGFETADAAAHAFAGSDTGIACIAGTEEMLRRHATATATALREEGAARVYVIGKAPPDSAIDAAIDEHVDAIRVLTEALEASG